MSTQREKEKEEVKPEKLVPVSCVFFPDKTCPVRKQQGETEKQMDSLLKYVKPESAGAVMIKEGVSMMTKAMASLSRVTMGALPEYCKSCPFLKVWSRALPTDR